MQNFLAIHQRLNVCRSSCFSRMRSCSSLARRSFRMACTEAFSCAAVRRSLDSEASFFGLCLLCCFLLSFSLRFFLSFSFGLCLSVCELGTVSSAAPLLIGSRLWAAAASNAAPLAGLRQSAWCHLKHNRWDAAAHAQESLRSLNALLTTDGRSPARLPSNTLHCDHEQQGRHALTLSQFPSQIRYLAP